MTHGARPVLARPVAWPGGPVRSAARSPARSAARSPCCDMSCYCLSKYHGRASRDALRVWSGWASTVIHGSATSRTTGRATSRTTGRATHRAPGPRHASGRRAVLRVGPPGRATRRAAGRAARRTNNSATAPLDLRTKGQTTLIHTNGHRGPARSGVYSRIHVPYAGTTLGCRTRSARVYYTLLVWTQDLACH